MTINGQPEAVIIKHANTDVAKYSVIQTQLQSAGLCVALTTISTADLSGLYYTGMDLIILASDEVYVSNANNCNTPIVGTGESSGLWSVQPSYQGLAGCWHMNEYSWTVGQSCILDISANKNHGTPVTSAAITDTANIHYGRGGNLYAGYISVPFNTNSLIGACHSFSVSFWQYRKQTAGAKYIFAAGVGSNDIAAIDEDDNYIRFYYGGELVCSVESITMASTMRHYAVSYDRATNIGKLYINGELRDSHYYTGTGAISAGQTLYIGANRTPTASNARIINEFSIWNRAITANEVMSIYKNSGRIFSKISALTCVAGMSDSIDLRYVKNTNMRDRVKKKFPPLLEAVTKNAVAGTTQGISFTSKNENCQSAVKPLDDRTIIELIERESTLWNNQES